MDDKQANFESHVLTALGRIEERTSALPELKAKIDKTHDITLINQEKHKQLEKRITVNRMWVMGGMGWLISITGIVIELLMQ